MMGSSEEEARDGTRRRRVRTFIVEEHNEAFYVWNYALQKELIKPEGNALLHVDEHPDNYRPSCNESLPDATASLESLKRFTNKELNIASFIVPAFCQGIFGKLYWVRREGPRFKRRTYSRYVYSHGGKGRRLFFEKNPPKTNVEDLREVRVHLRTVEQIPAMRDHVLDIDLDYFSAINYPPFIEPVTIEITKDEYNEFVNDIYHPMRLRLLRNRVEVVQSGDKYYYLIDGYKYHYKCELKRVNDRNSIRKTIERFGHQLKRKSLKPKIIDICRSRHSGYTPKEQCKFIESTLLKELRKNYDLEITHVQNI